MGPSLLYCQCCYGVFVRAFFVATPSKKAKKKTTSAAVRNVFEFKLLSEKAAADAAAGRHGGGGGGGGGGDGASVNGPTDGDVLQAAINMMNAFADKARRA